MPDWLFWVLYIGVPVTVVLLLLVVSAWCLDIVIRHYSK